MNSIKSTIYILVLFIAGVACRPADSLQTSNVSLPERFGVSSDTLSAARLPWRDFVADTALQKLIGIALRNNLDGMVALQRLEMARAGVRSTRGALKPVLSLGAEAAQRKWGLYTMDGAGNASTYIREDEIVPEHLQDYFIGFRASWEVDVWGKLKSKKAAALARYLASVEGRNFINTNIVAEVSETYYALTALDNELDIIRHSVNLQDSAFQMVQIQKEAGVANELAVRQMEVQLLNTKSLERQVAQEIFETEARLNLLLGRVAQPIQRDRSLYDSAIALNIRAGIPSDLLLNRPDIRQAEYELRAARADVSSARAAFLPALNVSGTLGYQAYKTSLLFMNPESIAYGLVGSLFAPILNRSEIKSQFEYAKAAQLEALYNYQRSILTGYTEVSVLLAKLEAVQDQIALKEREVIAADQSVAVANELFRTGRATYIEVIIAQTSALNTKRDLVNLQKLQYTTGINLYKALGGGSVVE